MEAYEDEETLSEITRSFGEDHDVWNKAFLEGMGEVCGERITRRRAGVRARVYFPGWDSKKDLLMTPPILLSFTNNLKADPPSKVSKE